MMDEQDFKKLAADLKAYCTSRYDLLKLELLEKLSSILGLILMALVVVLLLFAVFSFLGLALVFLLSEVLPTWASCCILAGIVVVLLGLAIANRERWFINPMVKALAGILFADAASEDAPAPAEREEDAL